MIEIEAHVLVFDLDDTLYLEQHFAESGFRALARQYDERIGGERFAVECAGLLGEGARGNIFDVALSRCGVEAGPDLICELVASYRSHTPEIEFCDDAARFLKRIGKRPTGLITDGPKEGQWAKIRALGLDEMIDHIVVTGEWGSEFFKPHPRAFERIESLTSSSNRNIVYIADNAAKDFITPRRLGWQTVQILRPARVHTGTASASDHEADHVISSFDELEVTAIA
ncbi:MAG: HAD family hydrolase [Erythrobacter sp.]